MGKSNGRRLKRYLGLRRSQAIDFRGGIDRILPSKLMGWVSAVDPDISFVEVRLLVGPHVISRVEINEPRPDVCEQLGLKGDPGFVLPLPVDLPPLDWDLPVRAVALSGDGGVQVELLLMKNDVKTEESLRAILFSDLRGVDGHVDGILDGSLVGWSGRYGHLQPVKIWLQADGVDPIELVCNRWREGMSSQQMPSECGFSHPLDSLPESWAEHSLWCSFDQSGHWPVPQDQSLFAPPLAERAQAYIAQQDFEPPEVTAISYGDQIALAPANLQEHWQALEDFRLFLDDLEQELNRRDGVRERQAQVQPQRIGWFGRLFRPVR